MFLAKTRFSRAGQGAAATQANPTDAGTIPALMHASPFVDPATGRQEKFQRVLTVNLDFAERLFAATKEYVEKRRASSRSCEATRLKCA